MSGRETWLRRLLGGSGSADGPAAGSDFVIFAQGRTGSSLLRSLLQSHAAVHCDGEILTDHVADPVAHVRDARSATGAASHGFKVKIYQLTDTQGVSPRAFLDTMLADGRRIVHLRRSNLLRHAISNAFAEARGRYHDRSEGARPVLELDPAELLGVMERRQAHLDREAAVLEGIEHLALEYEADLLDPGQHQATADRVFAYLGLPTSRVDTDLARSVSGDLRQRLANHDDVVAALRGTPYERHLDDPRYG